MTSFRKSLEHIYETSQNLGLFNILLAFEDNELDQIISIVKKVDIGNNETVLTAKSVGDEPDNLEPIGKSDSESNEEVTIHERFHPTREPAKKGIEIRDPKIEHEPMDYEAEPSDNPRGDGKRPVGDNNPRPLPREDTEASYLLNKPKKAQTYIKILDLDCVLDPERVIEDWYNNIMNFYDYQQRGPQK
ncbi:hypothetical protein Adt_32576 [Abeliophyllum distichum]|uniref:Uncharacterized protein n=1 Tax=Abeliophyllum distichum TaxID=126358 RepID=A0ABD1QTU2_9LAMI